jgi:hypothetical protein
MTRLVGQGHGVQGHGVQAQGSTRGASWCITRVRGTSSTVLHCQVCVTSCSLSMPSWLTAATNFWCISTDHTTRGFLAAEPSSSRA